VNFLDLGKKSDRIYAMMQDMIAKKVPIDGVGTRDLSLVVEWLTVARSSGLQMHIHIDQHPAFADVSANIKRLGDLGLEVHITEMDVSCPECGNGNVSPVCCAPFVQSNLWAYRPQH
jgi:endo-1,4-beta-xylanase